MTRILGAILAGGQSRRFGSDKAVALLDGQALIDRVAAALIPQVDGLVICGRTVEGMACVADRPARDLGPLGGLNAALHEAARDGYDMVVSVPCDAPFLPEDLVARLMAPGGATYLAALPVIGAWPSVLADVLDRHLACSPDRSMRRWSRIADASAVEIAGIANVNTVEDLQRLSEQQAGAGEP